jgi:hypothetical protein
LHTVEAIVSCCLGSYSVPRVVWQEWLLAVLSRLRVERSGSWVEEVACRTISAVREVAARDLFRLLRWRKDAASAFLTVSAATHTAPPGWWHAWHAVGCWNIPRLTVLSRDHTWVERRSMDTRIIRDRLWWLLVFLSLWLMLTTRL